jgi:hypothetical protein
MKISIVGYAGLPEVLTSDLIERPTRAMDLDTIREPIDAHGRIGSFVGSMENSVPHQLLKSRQRVFRAFDLQGL